MKSSEIKFSIMATDIVLFSFAEKKLRVFVVTVKNDDFKGMLALPGGLILPNETADDSVLRHMKDKAGVTGIIPEQLYTFSRIDRDPRGRVLSVAYFAAIPENRLENLAKISGAEWYEIGKLPHLAYDHDEIVSVAVERLRSKLEYTTIAAGLLPAEFTMTELQDLYEIILGKKFDKRNFRKKILQLGILKETDLKKGEKHRPAQLYRFSQKYGPVVPILI